MPKPFDIYKFGSRTLLILAVKKDSILTACISPTGRLEKPYVISHKDSMPLFGKLNLDNFNAEAERIGHSYYREYRYKLECLCIKILYFLRTL